MINSRVPFKYAQYGIVWDIVVFYGYIIIVKYCIKSRVAKQNLNQSQTLNTIFLYSRQSFLSILKLYI